MARSPHAYVRGNTFKFYEWLEARSRPVPEGPAIWICGDCHVGNLGPLADAKGRVAVQIRDLDQTVIGNPAHDAGVRCPAWRRRRFLNTWLPGMKPLWRGSLIATKAIDRKVSRRFLNNPFIVAGVISPLSVSTRSSPSFPLARSSGS
jgi:hypothetical protein